MPSVPRPDRRVLAGLLVAAVLAANVALAPRAPTDWLTAARGRPLVAVAGLSVLYVVRPLLAWPTTLLAAAVGATLGLAGLPLALLGAVVTAFPPYLGTLWLTDGHSGGRSTPDGDPTTDRPGDGASADGERAADGDGADVGGDGHADGPAGRLAAAVGAGRAAGRRYFRTVGGARGVAAARLAPVPSDPVTCAAAACGVGPRAFALGTLVGEAPWVFAAVAVGAAGGSVARAGDVAAVDPRLLALGGLGAAVLVAGPTYRALRGVGGAGDDGT